MQQGPRSQTFYLGFLVDFFFKARPGSTAEWRGGGGSTAVASAPRVPHSPNTSRVSLEPTTARIARAFITVPQFVLLFSFLK